MNLAEEMKQQTQESLNEKTQAMQQIKAYFQKWLESESFENYLRKKCADHLNEGRAEIHGKTWAYHDGCSDSHIQIGNCFWYNPDVKNNYQSRYWNGWDLDCDGMTILETLKYLVSDKLMNMGFVVERHDTVRKGIGAELHIKFSWYNNQ